jgi:DNA (cytosine-5)-methyltransferase 1
MVENNPPNYRPIGVDFFAGAGGMTLGFEQAGFDILASIEIDPIHCATHEFNFPFWPIFCQSIINTTGAEIRHKSSIGDREIDVVFGGPPCQGFSLIGKRSIEDPRNTLVFEFIRLVIELNPKYFVIENVGGMAIGEHKNFLDEIIKEFTEKGYKIENNYQILNAVEYGVPQKRERLFLLGCREELTLPNYPQKLTKFTSKKTILADNNLSQIPTVWDAIGDLPAIEHYSELLEQDWAIADYRKASEYSKNLRGFCPIDNDYSYPRKYDNRLLTSSLRTKHNWESIQRFGATKYGKLEPISHFHKLDPDGVCNTLRAGTASNRGAFTSPRPIHPFIPRCITVREAARLHSYPDWFRFHVTKWHGFRQVGNSVPPLLAKAVASKIIEALKVIPIKPIEIKELGDEKLLKIDMSEAAHYYSVDPGVIERRVRKIDAIELNQDLNNSNPP